MACVHHSRIQPRVCALRESVDAVAREDSAKPRDFAVVAALHRDEAGRAGQRDAALHRDGLVCAVHREDALACAGGGGSHRAARRDIVEVDAQPLDHALHAVQREHRVCAGGSRRRDGRQLAGAVAEEGAADVPLRRRVGALDFTVEGVDHRGYIARCEGDGLVGNLQVNIHVHRVDLKLRVALCARLRGADALRAEAETAVDADGRGAANGVVCQVDLANLFEEGRGLGVDLIGQGGLILVLEDCFEFRQNLCHFVCFLSII